ncbi:MAG: response regulator [Chloroflexota bacterium]
MSTKKTFAQMRKYVHEQHPTIGLLGDNLTSDFVTQLLLGTADAIQQYGANLICFPGGAINDPLGGRTQSNILYSLVGKQNVDGLIVMTNFLGTHLEHGEYEAWFENVLPKLPIVSLGLEIGGHPAILVDNYAGMHAAVTHLVEAHGYERIAFIRGPHGHAEADLRYRAYQDVLASHGLPLDPALVGTGDFMPPSGRAAMQKLLDEPHASCQAVVTANDLMAFGALEVLQERNLHVPYDIALVGFDDMTRTRYTSPPLTTVRQPVYQMGRQLVEMLIQMLAGQTVARQVTLPAELVVRQSCGCLTPSVAEAIGAPQSPARQPFETLDAGQRKALLAAMRQALDATDEKDDPARLEKLLDAFLEGLKARSQNAFLRTVDDTLRRAMDGDRPVAPWGRALSAMRKQMLPWLDAGQALLAEGFWMPAQIMVGEAAQQKQQSYTARIEQQNDALNQIRDILVTSFDVDELMRLLAAQLPRLDIPGCYVSLYEDSQDPTGKARLIMAYEQGQGQFDVPESQRIFPARQLVPAGLLSPDKAHRMVLEPLYFREEQLGFVLLEMGPREGNVYETLRGELSSTLESALLVQRIEERSDTLARQQYILDTFMENVPDRIYFKDTESRFTQVNQALLKKMGLQEPEEMLGKSDFDFFPAEQARSKVTQEQDIIRTGQPVLSLEEEDGLNQWASTTKMPLRDEKGRIIGTFGISRDITELVTAKRAAETAREEAEAARTRAELAKNEADKARQRAEAEQQKAEAANAQLATQIWQTFGQAQLNESMRGEQDIATLAGNVIQQLCEYISAQRGLLYVLDQDSLTLQGKYAYDHQGLKTSFQIGESLIGQAAVGKKTITVHVPGETFAPITSAGAIQPRHFLVAPFVYDGQTIGVVEIGTLAELNAAQSEFLEKALESIAIAFMTAQSRARVNELLTQTRQQAEELQSQEEELRATNEELEAQTESLRASEERLKANQAALEAANADLEGKTYVLQEQQAELDRQNQILRDAQAELQRKAEELALASKYKSEFLANMSHELRTPLNSMLILAGMLARNEDSNLTPDQIESAQVIHAGGTDLLNLINEILDLAKVEAGKMEFRFAPMPWERLIAYMHAHFDPVAERKGVTFSTAFDESLPAMFVTDQKRLEQILKNLLSNAFKFTEQGSVTMRIHRPQAGVDLSASALTPETAVAISVSDTGIGMSPEQQKVVFEAFQQADGSTSRQYGGTGLGLTITREMTQRLGGQVALESEPGQGSTFTIYLPLDVTGDGLHGASQATTARDSGYRPAAPHPITPAPIPPLTPSPTIPDDRDDLQPGDKALLIVEDDEKFAKIVRNYAHKKGFKAIVSGDGESAVQLCRTYCPAAVILDLKLPGMSGWDVLDMLKNDPDLRHIPVHIMSVDDEDLIAYQRGAMGFLTKPVNQRDLEGAFTRIESFTSAKIRSLLLVEDDDMLRKSVRKLLEGADVAIGEAASGQAALEALKTQHFDCMILDLTLPDISGFELLNRLDGDDSIPKCPVIVYTGKELSEEENQELLKYADSVIVKGVKSPERLLDETALFLHRVVADMPEETQKTIRKLHNPETVLQGKQILIVDDDARNAFALSKLLADKGVKMHIASSGAKALEMLETLPDVSLILTDIMMPGMDGYELIRLLRQQRRYEQTPIIALTAKAMMGDREKCLDAGASDYLSKPIDPERLFSMLRVWLSQQ